MSAKKIRLRTALRQLRRSLSVQEVSAKSQRITARVSSWNIFHQAQTIILYSPNENEVETDDIWQYAVRTGKAVYYPRITPDKQRLEFVRRQDSDPLIPGIFNILTPPGNALLMRLEPADIVLTPGVGFDRNGYRLGRGRGYYDRAFRGVLREALRIGLSYECQIVSHIPADKYDETLDYIVTENQLVQCAQHKARPHANEVLS